jgi:hypothetical protein
MAIRLGLAQATAGRHTQSAANEAQFLAAERRSVADCESDLRSVQLADIFELQTQAMTKRAFGPQLVE